METAEKIKKIHKEFRDAIDMSVINLTPSPDVRKVEQSKIYAEMLSNVGLTNSKAAQEASKILGEQHNIDKSNEAYKQLLDNQARFPKNRLIGINKVLDVCKKYDLYLGYINQYNGDIPETNLVEINDFKNQVKNSNGWELEYDSYHSSYKVRQTASPAFMIVAPLNMLNVSKSTEIFDRVAINNNVHNHKPEPLKFKFKTPELRFAMLDFFLDPIVLYPCIDNKLGKFFNIVTAWGTEADDEYVTNKIKIENSNN